MRRTSIRRLWTIALAAGLMLAVMAPSAARAETLDEARDRIWVIVQQADGWNQTVLNDFATAAVTASTVDELDAAYDDGYWDLEVRWYQASADLDQIADDFPDLSSDVGQAKAQLLNDHNGAHAEMDAIYSDVKDSLSSGTTTTTTTAPPNTTTTTIATSTTTSTAPTTTTVPRTTTTTVPKTTTTTVPRTTTTTVPRTTTTTVPRTTTTTLGVTTTTEAPAAVIGGSTNGGGGAGTPTVGDDPATARELSFTDGGTVDNEALSVAMADARHDNAPAMAMIAETASIVLPPGVVDMAARPLIALEFLVRTFFDSVGAMLVPFIALMIAIGLMVWREARRPRPVAG